MSLGNFVKQLLAEKQAETFTVVPDNAAITRDGGSAASFKSVLSSERETKERPTLAQSVLNADPVAPKLPLRQESNEALYQLSKQSAVSCATPPLPLRHLTPEKFSRKRLVQSKQTSHDEEEQLRSVVEPKHYQNALFGSQSGAHLGTNNKLPSVFASFCEETKGILMQLPATVE